TGGAWINPDFTARRNLQLVVEMFNLPKDKVKEALEVMGLTEAADKRVGTFSSGMAARLLLAFSLLRDAPVLLLDEPTVGVSPEAAKELLDHIAHLNRKGATVIYATHHIPEIQKLCTKVFIMDKGKVIAEGTPKQLIKSIGRKEVIELSLQGYTPDVENHLKALPEVVTSVSASEDNPHRSSTIRLHVSSSREALPSLIQLLVKKHDCQIRNIQIIEPNLEDVYMHFAGRRIE
ncbi:MAG: ATP-binding cassette domain-containing protein, partial [Candidatus Poribacteria bacterium]